MIIDYCAIVSSSERANIGLEYEDRLQKALNELRDVYDRQMLQNREDFSKLYETRVQELQTQLSEERGRASSSCQGLAESKTRIDALLRRLAEIEAANLSLTQQISELTQQMEEQNSAHRSQVRSSQRSRGLCCNNSLCSWRPRTMRSRDSWTSLPTS